MSSENIQVLPGIDSVQDYPSKSKRVRRTQSPAGKMKFSQKDKLIERINQIMIKIGKQSNQKFYQLSTDMKIKIGEFIDEWAREPYSRSVSREILLNEEALMKKIYKKKPFREKIFLQFISYDKDFNTLLLCLKFQRFNEPRDIRLVANEYNFDFDYPRFKNRYPFEIYIDIRFKYLNNTA